MPANSKEKTRMALPSTVISVSQCGIRVRFWYVVLFIAADNATHGEPGSAAAAAAFPSAGYALIGHHAWAAADRAGLCCGKAHCEWRGRANQNVFRPRYG